MNRSVGIIAGAGNGIGKHFASILNEKGFNLILIDRSLDQAERHLPPSDSILYYPMDVRDTDAWVRVVSLATEHWGKIDYLFNFAGIIQPSFIYNAPVTDIDLHIDINAKGSMYGTKIIGDYMKKQGRGHIINIASLAGIAPVPGIALYSASKFALRGFSLAAAYEYAPFGVTISVVCPDLVNTNMLDLQLKFKEETDLVFSGNNKPLQPADVTDALLALMKKPKREITIPASRGCLAKLASIWPALADRLKAKLMRKGARQKSLWHHRE